MGTTNTSASLVTERRRTAALASFYRSNQAAVNAGQSVRREQPTTQLNEVLLQRQVSVAGTNPNNGSDCPCSVFVNGNSGGANTNNVQ